MTSRFEKIVLACYAVLLTAYFFFVPSESGFGPGGVLTAILATGGHPNPPGYQTIGLIGEIWNAIPHSNPFLHFNRLGFLIACGTLAAAYKLMQNFKAGATATLVIGVLVVSITFQKHLLFFDRYMLGCLFMLLGMNEAIKIEKSPGPINWLPLGLFVGLAFISHLFASVGLIVFSLFFIPQSKFRAFQSWLSLFIGVLAGLLPIFWSFSKGLRYSFFNWGEIRSFQALINHVSRSERGPLPVFRSFGKLQRQADLLWNEFSQQYGGIGLLMLAITIAFLLWKIRYRLPRSLLIAALAVALTALATTNFSLGAPSSGIENLVSWMNGNYFLFFHVLIATGLAYLLGHFVKERHQKILSILVLALAVVSLNMGFQAHTYPQTLRKSFSQFPTNSIVLTQTDSLYFPIEAARLNGFDFEGPVLIHLHLLARSWYLRSLQKDGRIAPELQPILQKAELHISKSGGVAVDENDQAILVNLINEIVAHYEKTSAAFVIEFENSDPIAHSLLTGWVREPWGIAQRLFKHDSEVKEIKWPQNLDTLLKAQCHPAQQAWCHDMTQHYRASFEKRFNFVRNIFPSEAAAIKTALHP